MSMEGGTDEQIRIYMLESRIRFFKNLVETKGLRDSATEKAMWDLFALGENK